MANLNRSLYSPGDDNIAEVINNSVVPAAWDSRPLIPVVNVNTPASARISRRSKSAPKFPSPRSPWTKTCAKSNELPLNSRKTSSSASEAFRTSRARQRSSSRGDNLFEISLGTEQNSQTKTRCVSVKKNSKLLKNENKCGSKETEKIDNPGTVVCYDPAISFDKHGDSSPTSLIELKEKIKLFVELPLRILMEDLKKLSTKYGKDKIRINWNDIRKCLERVREKQHESLAKLFANMDQFMTPSVEIVLNNEPQTILKGAFCDYKMWQEIQHLAKKSKQICAKEKIVEAQLKEAQNCISDLEHVIKKQNQKPEEVVSLEEWNLFINELKDRYEPFARLLEMRDDLCNALHTEVEQFGDLQIAAIDNVLAHQKQEIQLLQDEFRRGQAEIFEQQKTIEKMKQKISDLKTLSSLYLEAEIRCSEKSNESIEKIENVA